MPRYFPALFLILILRSAYGKDFCTERNETEAMVLSDITGIKFLGCRISAEEADVALDRVNWLLPSGRVSELSGLPLTAIDVKGILVSTGASEELVVATEAALGKVAVSIQKVGRLSRSNQGCVGSLEPDLVAAVLVRSSSADEFNANLEGVCESTKSVRVVNARIFKGPLLALRTQLVILTFVLRFSPLPPMILLLRPFLRLFLESAIRIIDFLLPIVP